MKHATIEQTGEETGQVENLVRLRGNRSKICPVSVHIRFKR